jgi:hypothetical protein
MVTLLCSSEGVDEGWAGPIRGEENGAYTTKFSLMKKQHWLTWWPYWKLKQQQWKTLIQPPIVKK